MRTKRNNTAEAGEYKITKSKELWNFNEYNELSINHSRILHSYLCFINPLADEIKAECEIPIKWILKEFNLKGNSKYNIINAVKTFRNTWIDNMLNDITIFKKLEINYNGNGEEVIKAECSDQFIPYIFHLKGNFLTYDISNISMLNSHRHIILYELFIDMLNLATKKDSKNKVLSDKKFNTEIFPINIKVETILNMLNIKKCNSYTDLQNKFLRDAITAINTYTDIHIKVLSTIRKGNTVYSINFTVCNKCNDEQEHQTTEATDTDDIYIDNIVEKMNDNESYSDNVNRISEYFNVSFDVIGKIKSNVSEYEAIELLEKLIKYNQQYYYVSLSEDKIPKLYSMTDEATGITTDMIR